MLSRLRERVAALEASQKLHDRIPERVAAVEGVVDRQSTTIAEQGGDLSDIGSFHKTIKIALSIVGGLLVVIGAVIFFLFGDFVKTSMKMAREYDYCQEHRSDKDGKDCIVSPISVDEKSGKPAAGGGRQTQIKTDEKLK